MQCHALTCRLLLVTPSSWQTGQAALPLVPRLWTQSWMHFLQKLCLQLVEVELILSSRQIGQEKICFSCWCQEATSCSAVSSTILTKH